MDKQPFLNTYVNNLSLKEAVGEVDRLIKSKKPSYLVEVNVDVLVKAESEPYLKNVIDKADLVLADGKPLIWVSRLQKRPLKERAAGADLVPLLCAHASEKGYTVYLLGGLEEVLEKAKENIQEQFPGLKIAGSYSPPRGFEEDAAELRKMNSQIKAAKPDILFVFLGCPKQEKWIYENYNAYGAGISICAGGTVDFLAGTVKRAPKWMREHGLEWFFRFCMEPRRLFKRYFIDDVKFVGLLWKYEVRRIR